MTQAISGGNFFKGVKTGFAISLLNHVAHNVAGGIKIKKEGKRLMKLYDVTKLSGAIIPNKKDFITIMRYLARTSNIEWSGFEYDDGTEHVFVIEDSIGHDNHNSSTYFDYKASDWNNLKYVKSHYHTHPTGNTQYGFSEKDIETFKTWDKLNSNIKKYVVGNLWDHYTIGTNYVTNGPPHIYYGTRVTSEGLYN